MEPLPIDEHLPRIAAILDRGRAAIVVAEPGAGKTTRVPRSLLERIPSGEILVLEPRRLAARLAAARVAEELGERVGERVGYAVRFDDRSGPRTRLRFVTEGILTRRLISDARLEGVAAVVLDEFHERHLHGDLALAVLRRLVLTTRPDLALVVMSATLDADPIARFLDGEVVRVAGRRFEVAIEYRDPPSGKFVEPALAEQVAAAARRLVSEELDGDVLVFLPGAAEIRRATEACAGLAKSADLDVRPLHGEMPAEEQDRTIRAGHPGARRKIILSTNVAETSITLPNVVAVIDSGLARVARHSPWSGLPSLETERVSQASATQRAGRAGRTRDGRCLRLYTRHDFDGRPAHDTPEIARADLAETVLTLRARGEDPTRFHFLEAPPASALGAAGELLERLGALDAQGTITERGRQMLSLPLHPRLARLVLEARARGDGLRGCLAAALLGERDVRTSSRNPIGGSEGRRARDDSGPSDLLARVEALEAAGDNPGRQRAHGIDSGAASSALRARDQIARALGIARGGRSDVRKPVDDLRKPVDDRPLLLATLAGFPDRVARRRAAHAPEVVLAAGGAARLAETSVVREAEWMVLLEVDAGRAPAGKGFAGSASAPLVRTASAIEPEWLIDLFPEQVSERRTARFVSAGERVERVEELCFGALVLDRTQRMDATGPDVDEALRAAALSAGALRFVDDREAHALLCARIKFARSLGAELPLPDEDFLCARINLLCNCIKSFAELADALREDLRAQLAPGKPLLDRLAPERVRIGGRQARVEYPIDAPPFVASRIQDFFGMREGPRIGDGRVPLVLHLLAPNQRAVQVTSDLAGFWQRHYPTLRNQLMRRYPKHAWPEKPG